MSAHNLSLESVLFGESSLPSISTELLSMLKNTGSFSQSNQFVTRLQWLKSKGYKPINDSGAERIVFAFPENQAFVLKISRFSPVHNGTRTTQTLAEISTWSNIKSCNGEEFVTPVVDFDPKGTWLIATRAIQPVLLGQIRVLTGQRYQTFEDFNASLSQSVKVKRESKTDNQTVEESSPINSDWFTRLVEFLIGCDIDPYDLGQENWGMLSGKPVILDFGIQGHDVSSL